MHWDLIEVVVEQDIFRLPVHQELVGIVAEAEVGAEAEVVAETEVSVEVVAEAEVSAEIVV
jgi:hypothetical protein